MRSLLARSTQLDTQERHVVVAQRLLLPQSGDPVGERFLWLVAFHLGVPRQVEAHHRVGPTAAWPVEPVRKQTRTFGGDKPFRQQPRPLGRERTLRGAVGNGKPPARGVGGPGVLVLLRSVAA